MLALAESISDCDGHLITQEMVGSIKCTDSLTRKEDGHHQISLGILNCKSNFRPGNWQSGDRYLSRAERVEWVGRQ
jgi:hypothetical protein